MRPSPLLLALALLAAACGGNSSSTSSRCPATPCGTGQFCQADGTCATVVVNPDGGIAACTSQSEKPVGASSLPGSPGSGAYVLKHLAPVTVGQTVNFDVPAGITSITLIEQAISAPDTATFISGGSGVILENVAVPHTVTGPGGVSFNDVADGQTLPPSGQDPATYFTALPVYFFSDSPATGTLTIPNTSKGLSLAASGLPAGTWTALISDYAFECASNSPEFGKGFSYDSCVQGALDSTYDVTVIAKPTSGGIPATGTLDVMLNFVATSVKGVPLSAATAANDPNVKRLVGTLQALYAAKNITVNVSYQNAPTDVQTRYAAGVNIDKTGACSDLSQLLRYGATGNVLNIFLVPALIETSTGSATTVGIDGTIPGPASIGNTVASGAVVSAAALRDGQPLCTSSPNFLGCGADETAYIVAHEVGHFLGLYHPTEKYGFEFDPLGDTPSCKCTACSRQPSTCSDPSKGTPPSTADPVDVSECLNTAGGCGGGDDLMFWLLGVGSAGNLTPEQGQVMRANPLVF